MINRQRLTEEFLELVSIPSLSRQEGKVARRLESILKDMGASVEVDDAGERVGGDTGYILARFPGDNRRQDANFEGVAIEFIVAHECPSNWAPNDARK